MSEDFRKVLIENLNKTDFLATREIYDLFPEMNSQTVSWHLHKMLKEGEIVQASHGMYAIGLRKNETGFDSNNLSTFSKTAFDILTNSGFEFYLSGLDSLKINGFNINGDFPVIICADKSRIKDIQLELMRESDLAVTENDYVFSDENSITNKAKYYVLSTKAFELSSNNIALKEKAFIDLYYAITRMNYPVAISNLPRILSMIKPNEFKFKTSTRDRGLSDELNFLLNYDRQFIKAFSELL